MTEARLAEAIAHYLGYKYPDAIYHVDYGSGLKMTMGQARRQRVLNQPGFPDLQICEARNGYHGLFIELKREGTRVWLLDGTMTADRHIRLQESVLQKLRERGYRAEFAVGYEACCELIDDYFAAPE